VTRGILASVVYTVFPTSNVIVSLCIAETSSIARTVNTLQLGVKPRTSRYVSAAVFLGLVLIRGLEVHIHI
jgi:ABC-type dipeptide/oligopeptide/nickel transport system permease subunit